MIGRPGDTGRKFHDSNGMWRIGVAIALTLFVVLGIATIVIVLAWRNLRPDFAQATVGDFLQLVVITLGTIAGGGGSVALVVAYRRQKVHENTDRREETRLFNERFMNAAAQLGHDKPAVRLAGAHAIANLADDWRDQRQMCIDVLCSYLRHAGKAADAEQQQWIEDREVRHAILRIIADHLREGGAAMSWQGHNFLLRGIEIDTDHLDFAGATFSSGLVDMREITLSSGSVLLIEAEFSGGAFAFDKAKFTGGSVNFGRAVFKGGIVDFSEAEFSGSMVSFDKAGFSGGELSFVGSVFSNGKVSFYDAAFNGGNVHFGPALFNGGNVHFDFAVFNGGEVSFGPRAVFSSGMISFFGSVFSGGEIYFVQAEFEGGTVTFAWAELSGATVSFDKAEFSGGGLDLSEVKNWHGHEVLHLPYPPPEGLMLPTRAE